MSLVFDNGLPKDIGKTWVKALNPIYLTLGSMTKERAQYVLKHVGKFGELKYSFRHEFLGPHSPTYSDGINEVEDAFVKMTWALMDSTKSYYDAVVKISEGV